MCAPLCLYCIVYCTWLQMARRWCWWTSTWEVLRRLTMWKWSSASRLLSGEIHIVNICTVEAFTTSVRTQHSDQQIALIQIALLIRYCTAIFPFSNISNIYDSVFLMKKLTNSFRSGQPIGVQGWQNLSTNFTSREDDSLKIKVFWPSIWQYVKPGLGTFCDVVFVCDIFTLIRICLISCFPNL